MTFAEAMAMLLRRWPVVGAGVALTMGALFVVGAGPGVYSAQTDVLFLAPKTARAPNPIEASSQSLIATAGLVARMVNRGVVAPAMASTTVSLASQGIRKGHSIELPDSGGQWVSSFDRPVLVVQVAGPSEEWVRSTLTAQIDRIETTLAQMQQQDGISDKNTIITSSAPRLAAVDQATGDRKRVAAAMLLLGGALTVLAAVGVDRLLARWRAPAPRTARTRKDFA